MTTCRTPQGTQRSLGDAAARLPPEQQFQKEGDGCQGYEEVEVVDDEQDDSHLCQSGKEQERPYGFQRLPACGGVETSCGSDDAAVAAYLEEYVLLL